MTKKVIFTGCSFTAGTGWNQNNPYAECKDHPHLWVNLCYQHINQLAKLELINVGIGGASNSEIFENTIHQIAQHNSNIDTLFCQWTAAPRWNFNVGFEPWNTSLSLNSPVTDPIILSNGTTYSIKELKSLIDKLKTLHHLHYEIVKILKYSAIIQNLCAGFNIKCIFINGVCPWDNNYFTRLENAMPIDYTNFTKNTILEVDSRKDKDIFLLYERIHNDYNNAGGVKSKHWVNLYESMLSQISDTNYDNIHPGKDSNIKYFKQIKQYLNQNT